MHRKIKQLVLFYYQNYLLCCNNYENNENIFIIKFVRIFNQTARERGLYLNYKFTLLKICNVRKCVYIKCNYNFKKVRNL
jgi:hypothetical protein